MKNHILILLLFISSIAPAQCPPGKVYVPSIGHGDIAIVADTCVDKAWAEFIWRQYFMGVCGERTAIQYSTYYRIIIGNTWNDTTGCQPKTTYQKRINGAWATISKCLWYWDNKSRFACYGGDQYDVKLAACCGHYHDRKPLW